MTTFAYTKKDIFERIDTFKKETYLELSTERLVFLKSNSLKKCLSNNFLKDLLNDPCAYPVVKTNLILEKLYLRYSQLYSLYGELIETFSELKLNAHNPSLEQLLVIESKIEKFESYRIYLEGKAKGIMLYKIFIFLDNSDRSEIQKFADNLRGGSLYKNIEFFK